MLVVRLSIKQWPGNSNICTGRATPLVNDSQLSSWLSTGCDYQIQGYV